MPEGAMIPSKHVLEKSPVAFVMLEDDRHMLETYWDELAGLPVVLCDNVNDALEAMSSLQAKGKEIKIYTDANVPLKGYDGMANEVAEHPALKEVSRYTGRHRRPGPALAWAIADGHFAGITPEDISVLSYANSDELPEGSRSYSKDGRHMCEWLRDRMEDAIELVQAKKVRRDKCVVIVDDEPEWGDHAKKQIEKRFNCPVEVITEPAEALERVKRGDVAAVITDQMMPAMTGEALANTLRQQEPTLPTAIITGSYEFYDGYPGHDDPKATPVMLKHDIDDMQYGHNRLRHFLNEAFNGGPSLQA